MGPAVTEAAPADGPVAGWLLRRARLAGRDGLWDVEATGGALRAVRPARADAPAPGDHDAGGRAVIPGLVDAHVHLDKAYALGALERLGAFDGPAPGLAAAIGATRALRATMGLDDLVPGMHRLLAAMVRAGTVAARVHVEIDPALDPATVAVHRQVTAEYPGLTVQLVAFPQNGTSADPSMPARLAQALDDGCEVVGGCPYADDDPRRHLDLVFGLARERDLPVDLHLDLTDDPGAAQLDLVLPLVERAGLAGRVTVGHMTALAATPPTRLAHWIGELARHDIALVSLPTTDLWLSGRDRFPVPRGVAPIRDLLDGGVRVALASNNHQNAFTPVGAGGLLRVAWLASLVAHIGDPAGQARLLDAVSASPAAILGLGQWDVEVGGRAPLLVLDAEEPLDAVREAPPILARLG
ncbi:amidohydrolase family protein [Frankia sp. AgKG'84/4]